MSDPLRTFVDVGRTVLRRFGSSRRSLAVMGIAALVLWPIQGQADGDPVVKKLQPRAHLGVGMRYDDNVFLDPTHETNDIAFVISPGLGLFYGDKDRNYVAVDYTLGIERYDEVEGQDANNHLLTFETHLEARHFIIDLSHLFQDLTGANVDVGNRVEEQKHVTRAEVEYRLSEKTGVGVNYRQELHDYESATLTDFDIYEVGGSVFYRVQPKTDLLVQFNQGWVNVDNDADEDYQEVNLGVRGELTSKIKGTVKAGYQHRNFDRADSDDADIISASVALQARFSEHLSAELSVSRTINPSPSSAGNSYEMTRVGLTLAQKVGRRLTLSANAVYERDEYDRLIAGVDRRDDYWELGCGADYDVTKWLRIGAHYRHASNSSTLDTVEFDQNLVTVEALLRY